MILIVAPPDDLHALCVAQDLKAMGKRFQIADPSQLSNTGGLEFRAGQQSRSTWTGVDGNPIALEKVKTVWHRRRFFPTLQEIPDLNDQAFIKREWSELFSGIFSTMDAFFVNEPARQELAVKPLQLRMAEQLGLRIPDTLITNDPAAAEAFIERHGQLVVHKTLSPPRHRFLATTKWSPSQRVALKDLVFGPVIFQETITNCTELRVTVIGEQIFAAAFRPPDGLIDGRFVDTPYRSHELPKGVASQLLSLVRGLGLVFSTIDLKLTEEGEYVFLELNPQGQYLYVEILSGMPLTDAMAQLLANGDTAELRIPGSFSTEPVGSANPGNGEASEKSRNAVGRCGGAFP